MSKHQRRLKDQAEDLCKAEGCPNYCATGYTLCHGHTWGFPIKASDEVLRYAGRLPRTRGAKV